MSHQERASTPHKTPGKDGACMEDLNNKRAAVPLLLLSIAEVATSLGMCRSKVYELIAKEGLPVMRFGRSVRVSPTALQQWLEEREQRSADEM